MLDSVTRFIANKRISNSPLLNDELLHEFMVRRSVLRQKMIDAGAFEDGHRLPSLPLEGPVQAALLTLAADVAHDRLPLEIEAFAARIETVVNFLSDAEGEPPQESGRPNPNDPRDKFIYDARSKGRTLAEIKAKVNKRRGWEPIESDQGIAQAAKRYAKRHKKPLL